MFKTLSSENSSTTHLYSTLTALHRQGLIALHMTPDVVNFYDKLDDRRIINNLREDGGSEYRQATNYQLYPQVSATILPPSSFAIGQFLYTSHAFIAFNLQKSTLKGFSPTDAASIYCTNKHNRPSYSGTIVLDKFSQCSKSNRLDYLQRLNHQMSDSVTKTIRSRFFSLPPNFQRGMNELIVKIYGESVLCIGSLVDVMIQHPELLFDLIKYQQELNKHLGILLPITLYNNTKNEIIIDFVEEVPQKIAANQFYQIDPNQALQQILKRFPERVNIPIDKHDKEVQNEHYQNHLIATLEKLSKLLPSYLGVNPPVRVLHKRSNPQALLQDHYLEIDQAVLKRFISSKTPELTEQKHRDLVKLYNLQFRLEVYKELLEQKQGMINYSKLQEDLFWAKGLIKRYQELEASPTVSPPSLT